MAHPLCLGVVLLFVFSAVAGRASWGFPEIFDAGEGLGGEDVESYLIEDGTVVPESFDAALIAGAGIGAADENGVAVVAAASDEGLVTVPWSPVMPAGLAARNVVEYAVQRGDTLSTIAASFGVSARAIAWSNNIVDPDAIQPGDRLRIPPVAGVLHVAKEGETIGGIARRYAADARETIAFNALPADGTIRAGDEIVIPGGTPPAPPKPKPVPRPSRPSAPQFAQSQVPFGYWIAPTTGRNYGRRHSNNGVDIANACGTPVYAAASGRVRRADASGWNGGYGVVVEVDHPNGTATRYAHLSQIVAWAGWVEQGQLIGLIGTTGRSTGCHLHFEVHGARNPLVR